MTPKLTPSQRRQIFHRWLEGNQAYAAGEIPETMAQIGARFGVTEQAVNYIIRRFSGNANRRPGSRKPGPCLERCGRKSEVRGRCRRCENRRRYREDPGFLARLKATQAAYRERRRRGEAT